MTPNQEKKQPTEHSKFLKPNGWHHKQTAARFYWTFSSFTGSTAV